ncbi:unnamed protein product [Symbiodinium natans]|uniref:Uncharacterized protein n=1 Tax=Symbiodinium natans TaxID=878477 RepID=A0A812IMQ3_9DINO|nr:unnamed protein product [Symbiodinium natans]
MMASQETELEVLIVNGTDYEIEVKVHSKTVKGAKISFPVKPGARKTVLTRQRPRIEVVMLGKTSQPLSVQNLHAQYTITVTNVSGEPKLTYGGFGECSPRKQHDPCEIALPSCFLS